MVDRSRFERCSKCGVQMLVPPLSWSVRCEVCHTVTSFRRSSGQVHHNLFGHVTGWLKDLVSSDHMRSASPQSSFSNRYKPAAAPVRSSFGGWPQSYPRGCWKKRAVLCGVSYIGRSYELKGTVNDVNCLQYLLTKRYKFPEDCILILTEEQEDPYRIPTRANIISAMRWLVNNCQSGDSLLFHFSGHGSQKVDTSGADEKDGFDETLCPLDYETSGMILDDEINDILVSPIPPGVKLHAIIDSCHSGTVLDLPYVCRVNRAGIYEWENHSPSNKHKGTSGGLAICISGCADYQTSADTNALSGQTTTGAMTYSFIHAVENDPGATYGNLLFYMRSAIRGANTNTKLKGPLASIAKRVFSCRLKQEPQLSSSEEFDIYKRPFLL